MYMHHQKTQTMPHWWAWNKCEEFQNKCHVIGAIWEETRNISFDYITKDLVYRLTWFYFNIEIQDDEHGN